MDWTRSLPPREALIRLVYGDGDAPRAEAGRRNPARDEDAPLPSLDPTLVWDDERCNLPRPRSSSNSSYSSKMERREEDAAALDVVAGPRLMERPLRPPPPPPPPVVAFVVVCGASCLLPRAGVGISCGGKRQRSNSMQSVKDCRVLFFSRARCPKIAGDDTNNSGNVFDFLLQAYKGERVVHQSRTPLRRVRALHTDGMHEEAGKGD